MTQIQGPSSSAVDLESTDTLNGAPTPRRWSSDEPIEGLIDPHLWPADALERVLAAIESTR